MCFPKNLQCTDVTMLGPLFSTWKADWVYRRCRVLGHHQLACWAHKLSWYLCIVKMCHLKKCKGKTILNQESFFRHQWEQTWCPACLADRYFRETADKNLSPGSSLVWCKCIYFLHTLSWHRSLFQKPRETVGSFIGQSLREPVNCKII